MIRCDRCNGGADTSNALFGVYSVALCHPCLQTWEIYARTVKQYGRLSEYNVLLQAAIRHNEKDEITKLQGRKVSLEPKLAEIAKAWIDAGPKSSSISIHAGDAIGTVVISTGSKLKGVDLPVGVPPEAFKEE